MICFIRCGVEQWQLVGLITRRSQVQVLSPLLKDNQRPPVSGFSLTRRIAIINFIQKGENRMNRKPSSSSVLLSQAIDRGVYGLQVGRGADRAIARLLQTQYAKMLKRLGLPASGRPKLSLYNYQKKPTGKSACLFTCWAICLLRPWVKLNVF